LYKKDINKTKFRYPFPVTDLFHAREVTKMDFDISEHNDYYNLYIDLDTIRINDQEDDYRKHLKICLNINPSNNILETPANDYIKIIFSGHRGTGKTQELRRLQNELNHPDRYFSVLIELEEELEIAKFQVEDYFILLIFQLARTLEKRGVNSRSGELDKILKNWYGEKEITKEVKNKATAEINTEIGTGFDFFKFFKLNLNLKGSLATENAISTTIRQKVKKNPLDLISQFNLALTEIREDLKRNHLAKDILFIIDGSERIPYDVYEQLFVKDSYILRDINANIISSIRLDSYYNIEVSQQLGFFQKILLPMINLKKNTNSIQIMREIITIRLNENTFFDEDVLDYFVKLSGGCVRQLLRIVNQGLLFTLGKKITMIDAQRIKEKLALEILETLTTEYQEVLNVRQWNNPADPKIATLIFNLVLMKYNGHLEINPLIQDEF
jgi:hypothetical protein